MLIFWGIISIVAGVMISAKEVEVEVPTRSFLSTKTERIVPIPNIVFGLIWVAVGIAKFILAFMLLIWGVVKRIVEAIAKSQSPPNKP